MWLALILLAQLLHRDTLVPAEAQVPQPAKSDWPLKECQTVEIKRGGCVCQEHYQICQPLQLSARVNGSVTLPCSFAHHPGWATSKAVQVHWRLGDFHATRYLFNCCTSQPHTDPDFQGRVSLAMEAGQQYSASIHITNLRASDSRRYFCRVSVGKKEWQTVNGTNLTVTAFPQQPEGRNAPPLTLGFLIGVSTGAILLAAALVLGLAMFFLARRKGHCPERTPTRRIASGGQDEKEAEHHELHSRGARACPWGEPASQHPHIHTRAPGEEGLVYAALRLSGAPDKQGRFPRGGRAAEETTYAAVRC